MSRPEPSPGAVPAAVVGAVGTAGAVDGVGAAAHGRAGFTVREATDAELDAAGAAVLAAYTADGLTTGSYGLVLADARGRARESTVVVALDGAGQVVGTVTFALPGSPWSQLAADGEAEFRMLGVPPPYRGRGVGAALTRWCVDRARGLGRRRLVLSSQRSMAAAHGLYTSLGFTRRPDLDWSTSDGVRLLGFSLDLG